MAFGVTTLFCRQGDDFFSVSLTSFPHIFWKIFGVGHCDFTDASHFTV